MPISEDITAFNFKNLTPASFVLYYETKKTSYLSNCDLKDQKFENCKTQEIASQLPKKLEDRLEPYSFVTETPENHLL